MTSEEYKNLDAINQSRLKTLLRHPRFYINAYEDSEEDYFVFGQFIEDFLLQDDDYMESKYFVTKTETPSPGILKVLNHLSKSSIELHLEAIDKDLILQACLFYEYGKSWKPDTTYNKILEVGSDYYYELKQSEGKIRLDEQDYQRGLQIVSEAKDNPFVRKYIMSSKIANTEVIPKIRFTFKHRGYNCKGEIDLLFLDHKNKIAKVIDIKTSSQALVFNTIIMKYRYDFQVEFYTLGAILGGLIPEGYSVETPEFLVLDVEGKLPATMWQSPIKGDVGVDFVINNRKYEGINSAFNRLDFHTDTDQWDYPMEYYKNGYIEWS